MTTRKLSELDIIYSITSPNLGKRPLNAPIDTIVLHHTATKDLKTAIKILTCPEAAVSSHYVLDKDGKVFQLVPEEKRAWHAGVSFWKGRENINHYSIGIEIINDGYEAFTSAQIEVLISLIYNISLRHPIIQSNIVAHSDIALGRKVDPHSFFPWHILSLSKIGIYIENNEYNLRTSNQDKFLPNQISNINASLTQNNSLNFTLDPAINVKYLQTKLSSIGYGVKISGKLDFATIHAIYAFYRRHKGIEPGHYRTITWTQADQLHLDKVHELYDKHGKSKLV